MSKLAPASARWINGVEPPQELLKASGTEILELECREQPARLRALLSAYAADDVIQTQLETFRTLAKQPGPIFFIGMGASYCSAITGSIQLQTHGRLAVAIDAGEWLHYGKPVWNTGALSVLLTTSGESAELVALLQQERSQPLGLICNNPASKGWNLAANRLPILAGPEYGNATKTYTNATAATIILASEMVHQPWKQDAEEALDVFAADLDPVFAQRAELREFCDGAANIEVIGRGAAYSAAVMGALTLREMSGFRAAPHTGAGFKHGPNLDVGPDHVSVIFAVGRAADLGLKLAAECNRRGGRVVLVSAEQHERTDLRLPVRIGAIPEPWEAISALLVMQALTLATIEKNGCRLPPRFQYGVMEQ